MSSRSHTLSKAEKLKSRKAIDSLFRGGLSLHVPPVRLLYCKEEGLTGTIKVGVTASKRSFRKAVDRNRLKRLLREAYRLQKDEPSEWIKGKGFSLHLFLVYTSRDIVCFADICTTVKKLLHRMINDPDLQ